MSIAANSHVRQLVCFCPFPFSQPASQPALPALDPAHNYTIMLSILTSPLTTAAATTVAPTASHPVRAHLTELYSLRSLGYPPAPVLSHLRLTHLSIVHRHGARTPKQEVSAEYEPVQVAPTAWKHCVTWRSDGNIACAKESLTALGGEHACQLGRWLRHAYHDFIPSTYQPNRHHCRSTNKDRTITSTLYVLRGLYSDSPSSDTLAAHLAIGSDPEVMYGHPSHSSALNDIYWRSYDALLPAVQCEAIEDVRSKISAAYRLPIRTILELTDTLMATLAAHVPLPDSVEKEDVNTAMLSGSRLFYHTTRGDQSLDAAQHIDKETGLPTHTQLQRQALSLALGGFVQELMQPLTHALASHDSGSDRPAFPLVAQYAGHDTTLLPLCEMLGFGPVVQALWPPFTTNLLIELYSNEQESPSSHWIRCICHVGNEQHLTPLVPADVWMAHLKQYCVLEQREGEQQSSQPSTTHATRFEW